MTCLDAPLHRVFWQLNTANYFTLDCVDKMNFRNPFFSSEVFPLGIVDIWWVETQKGTPSEYRIRFPSVPLVCRKTFPIGCAQDTVNYVVLALVPPTLGIPRIFHNSSDVTETFMGLPSKRGDSVYVTRVICSNRGQIEPKSVFRATTDSC